MNKVITINLNGMAYQLEESGYDALRAYLDHAARRLEGNPDRDEIIADIEQAIADKFRAVLGTNKTVVVTKEVQAVIAEMGPVQDAADADEASSAGAAGKAAPGAAGPAAEPKSRAAEDQPEWGARRLYRVPEGAMIAGVCNGLAVYFNVDVTIVRILFVILTLTWGAGLLVYVLMGFIVPKAQTAEEKAAAFGGATTAQEFIRRAKEGYYEGMKTFHDKRAHREWRRKFKQDMRGWKRQFQWEMHQHAGEWRQNWQQHWAQQPRPHFGPFLALPFVTLLNVLLSLAGVGAVICLIATGAVFGVTLPAGMPLWVGVVLLILAWRLATWPLRMIRYACYYQGGYRWAHPMHGGDSILGLAFVLVLIWLGDHYSPEFHALLVQVPPLLHRGVDWIQAWLARR